MKFSSLLAIALSGLFYSTESEGQVSYYRRPGVVIGRPAPTAMRLWAAPVIADAFEANPLDDGYDYPFGYGEYAVYGRWAIGANCYLIRLRVPAGHGSRWRTLRRCD